MLALILISNAALGQTNEVSLTGSIAKKQGSVSVAIGHNWDLGKKNRFAVGTGIRFTSYVGSEQFYITAPARLTSGSTGPLVIFKKNIEANIDSFRIESPHVVAVNLFINLRLRISANIHAGFNIDAIGFSFGKRKSGTYINQTENRVVSEQARPTAFNLLLVSDNDRGSLNSELYLTYSIHARWSLKIAAAFLFTEYTTDTDVQQNPETNDRFRNKSLMLAFGVTHRF